MIVKFILVFSFHCKAELNYRIGSSYTFLCCYILCSWQVISSGWYTKVTCLVINK